MCFRFLVKYCYFMAIAFKRTSWRIILNTRSIMTSNFDFSKVKEELEKNPYFNNYAKKIKQFQKSDPEEFVKKLKACEEKKKTLNIETRKVVYGDRKAPNQSQVKQTKTLNEIMKIDMLEDKSKDEIVSIWHEFHKDKNVVYGTLTTTAYETLNKHSSKYGSFLLPLPRGKGYEFIMLQFENNEVHFTSLISYHTHKEDAPECLTLVYYSDLVDSKGIVLMKGEYDKNILSPIEAQFLVNLLHLYYGENDEKRIKLMDTFNYDPENFQYMNLITEMDLIPLQNENAPK